MFVSTKISVDKLSKFPLNVIISFLDIPCLHSFIRMYISENKLLQKLQHMTVVDQ